MKILVTGGTGYVGTALCRVLHERGHDVTALSRHPEDASLPADVSVVAGDVTAYDSIEAAFEGKDAVVNLVALSPLFEPRGGPKMHDRVTRGGTENCVRAAEEHGVTRFVQQSFLDADPDHPVSALRAKGRADELVRASDLDWVIVRPSVIFGEGGEFIRFTKLLAPPYVTPLPMGGKTKFQPIWIEDFVPILADAVEKDEHVGHVYEIGGPEAFSLADIARFAHRADGRSVNVVPLPGALVKLGLDVAGFVPFVPFGPDQYRSLQVDNVTRDNDVTAFGVEVDELRTLQDYLGL